MRIGVFAVIRRAYCDGRTTRHCAPARSTSTTDTPCAACDLRTFSALQVFWPSGCSSPSSVYSWFIASRPCPASRDSRGSGKYSIAS